MDVLTEKLFMDKNNEKAALDYHRYPRPGKIEVVPTKPYDTPEDLALAYSPGVAYPCISIKENPADIFKYTNKGNLVAVISNGTAVLGLGDIDEKDPQMFIRTVASLAPTFGGINLEDIKAPECFMIESELRDRLDIPVMHDDQHGTAIISGAALLNAAELQGKKLSELRLVVNGAGAAAIACTRLYCRLGVKRSNIVMCDSRGVIRRDRTNLSAGKAEFATDRDISTLAEALVDADMFLGLSVADVLTPDMIMTMASNPIVFALANPEPEIAYDLAISTRADIIFATGRSDYPNQINNVLGFPYIFRGALDCGATTINEEMKIAAARAIASLAREQVPEAMAKAYGVGSLSFGRDYILPKPFDRRLLTVVAPAVIRAAESSGVATIDIQDFDEYEKRLMQIICTNDSLIEYLIKAHCQCK